MALTISRKCQGIAPSITLKISAHAKELCEQGLDVIGLGAGEPDFDTPAHICRAAHAAIDAGMTHYTPASGTMALRKAICDTLKKEKNLSYSPAEVLVSNGAKHSLMNVFEAILDPGDEVIIPSPCWVSYPEIVRMAGGTPVFVAATEAQGFVPDIADIAAAVTRRTKAVIVNTPGNPTGCVWSREQLAALAALAVKKQFYVVSDEIYEKLIYDGAQHVCIATLGEDIKAQTLIVNGVSKAYAMTGWRIGYTVGPREVIAAMAAYQSHATSNPNSIAQQAALAAYQGDQQCVSDMRDAFERRRNLMVRRINQIKGLSCALPKGSFYVMLNIQSLIGKCYHGRMIASAFDFAQLLLSEQHVAVIPGESFGAEGFCRLSYTISEERINEAMDRLMMFVCAVRAAA